MKPRYLKWLVNVALLVGAPYAAADGLVGSTVSYTGYCCDAIAPADIVTNTATAVVGTGVEFPAGAIFGTGVPDSVVDVSAFRIVATVFTTFTNTFYESGAFDGGVLTFYGRSFTKITGVTVDPASTFFPVGVTFTDNSIIDNVAGLPFVSGDTTILDVQVAAAVPEPSGVLMLVGGLLLVGFQTRRLRG